MLTTKEAAAIMDAVDDETRKALLRLAMMALNGTDEQRCILDRIKTANTWAQVVMIINEAEKVGI